MNTGFDTILQADKMSCAMLDSDLEGSPMVSEEVSQHVKPLDISMYNIHKTQHSQMHHLALFHGSPQSFLI